MDICFLTDNPSDIKENISFLDSIKQSDGVSFSHIHFDQMMKMNSDTYFLVHANLLDRLNALKEMDENRLSHIVLFYTTRGLTSAYSKRYSLAAIIQSQDMFAIERPVLFGNFLIANKKNWQ